jgi:hypothetical protein
MFYRLGGMGIPGPNELPPPAKAELGPNKNWNYKIQTNYFIYYSNNSLIYSPQDLGGGSKALPII